MTLEEWCQRNDHQDYIDDWDYETSGVAPDEISANCKKYIFIKCHRGLHGSKRIMAHSLTKRSTCLCDQCNSLAQYIIDHWGERVLQEIWSERNGYSPYDVAHSSSRNVILNCLDNPAHGSYSIRCNTLMYSKHKGCPRCHVRGVNGKPTEVDSLGSRYPLAIQHWSAANELTPFEVTPKSHKRMWWRCGQGLHADYNRSVAESVRYEFRCPQCSQAARCSMLEEKVTACIERLGYNVLHEYGCTIIPERTGVPNNRFLPYDNEVPELKLVVEVHGKQHYMANSWHRLQAERNGTTQAHEFEEQRKRDEFKRIWALAHGYHYLAIPYTAETGDQYIDIITQKIAEIIAKESVTTTA